MKTFEVEQIVSSIFNSSKKRKTAVVEGVRIDGAEVKIDLTKHFDITFDALQRLSNALGTKKINIHHQEGEALSEQTFDPSINTIYVILPEPIEKG